jgi:ABC-2 type transport system ATP-binding protein
MTSQHFPHTDTPSAELAGVNLSYGEDSTVLQNLDWQLLPGQVVGLLGRNGAGKTTLLETLLGLREPQAGSVKVFGQSATQLSDAVRARIGYVPQQNDLFEGFTATQLLAYFRSFYPRWDEARVEGLLSRWEIPRDRPIRKLSGGQVLDRGTTVVFSTHILSDLERVAFNLAFLSRGRIALQAPLDELLDQVRAFTGSVSEMAGLMGRLGAQTLKRTPLEAGRERVLARLPAHTALPADVAADRVNLDDLFAELT